MKNSPLTNRTFLTFNTCNSFGNTKAIIGILKLFIFLFFLTLNTTVLKALPSYARQLGMSCTACHYSFPELTSFGRQFKLNGYTMTGMQTIQVKSDSDQVTRLNLLSSLPLSVMVQSSFTSISKKIEDVQNNSVAFPQQLSMFYAGQVTPHIGTFIQVTYDGQSFGIDNADIRYANHASIGSKNMIYGFTLNNNPTVQDVWNTIPAWRFPSASPEAGNSPAKSPLIENLGMQVAGLGAYAQFNSLFFAELTFYRSAQQGAANPSDVTNTMVIKNLAPYWRLALQHEWSKNYLELGAFGLSSKQFVNGISGEMDNFTDAGIDLQYERHLNKGTFTLHSSYIYESESRVLTNTNAVKLDFDSFKIDGNLYFANGFGATIGYFNSTGSEDEDVVGSLTNKPNSNGYIFQLEYLPWYNTKFSIQYVMYNKFDGSINNYDGMGRNAANNNSLYILAWINF